MEARHEIRGSAMKNSPHLTVGYAPVLARQIALTRPGMAHWSASGPFGAVCG
jgi:hypothetical protein